MKTWSLPVHLSGAIAAGMTPVAARPSRKAGPKTEQSVFATIDAHIQRQRKTAKVPGLALGIVQGDQILYLRGYGKADESGRAVTPQTPFLIGSTTKSFTALAIMQLVEAGMIELDAPIQRYIPWFRVADPIASARITVRHLLNQTSGLSTAAGVLYGLSGSLTRSLEERVRSLRTAKLDRPVGDSFEYTNANYLILGCLIQAVSHQPYEVYIQRHIFQPLEMHHSYVSEEQAKRHGLATGYRFWFGFPFPWNTPFPLGAVPEGGLLSTAEDMCHYLSLYLNEGRYRGKALLSPAGIAQMERATVTANMFADVWGGQKRTTSYGMGWFTGEIEGTPVIFQAGDYQVWHADIVLLPQESWGIVVLQNTNGLTVARFQRIAATVAGMVNGRPGREGPDIGRFYRMLDLTVALVLTVQTWSLSRLVRQHSRLELPLRGMNDVPDQGRRWILPLVWEIGLAGGILTWGPRPIGKVSSWISAFRLAPDEASVILLVSGLWLITGLTRMAEARRAWLTQPAPVIGPGCAGRGEEDARCSK